ncbi:hypothetical protein N7492_005957 [Penicillium capsulatum]|uniref:Gag1-like clamp domain-containing protein n=1 Tax=Penicillium capsulatum TaxID=69766 RepID=A0A9W9LRI1_9EURO|nr:hypothetical protein N7492_005957 [Penicillium capsulatum]KAJ6134940.1 hypothetical protein N7512_000100 [Penicillium capsulatum]
MPESREAAIREAKRFVREVVRNDWEFEPPTELGDARPTSSSSTSSIGTLYQNREVIEWRCREVDSSGSELEPQSSDHDMDADSTDDPEIELRRKRRRQMEDEMGWNEGLRMWTARRDAWSGARTRRQIRAKEAKQKQAGLKAGTADASGASTSAGQVDAALGPAGSPPLTDLQSRGESKGTPNLATKTDTLSIAEREKHEDIQRRQEQEEEHSTAPDEEAKRKESSETSITEPDALASAANSSNLTKLPTTHDTDSDISDIDEEEELDEPLVPVAPPFLSTSNPIRATINQNIYPSIYSKVVVQGMTPTVPVNLADLTKAMVQGWKSDGQWPPKPAVSSIVFADDATVPKKDADRAPESAPSRRKNSITNAMRKVFHIGSHPFHRRGSQDAGQGNGAANGSAAI